MKQFNKSDIFFAVFIAIALALSLYANFADAGEHEDTAEYTISPHCEDTANLEMMSAYQRYPLPTVGPYALEIKDHVFEMLYNKCMIKAYRSLRNSPGGQGYEGEPD